LLGTVARQVLDDIGVFASAIIAAAGITFGVLVGENAAGGQSYVDFTATGKGFELQLSRTGKKMTEI